MPIVNDEIRARTEAFAADLAALVRKLALESVRAAIGGTAPAKAVATTVPAEAAPKPRVARKAAPTPPKAKPASKKRVLGKKRPLGDIQKLTDKLAAYIAAHPGAGMGAITVALASPRGDLVLPAKKLIAAGKIRTEGKKRSTRYFPV